MNARNVRRKGAILGLILTLVLALSVVGVFTVLHPQVTPQPTVVETLVKNNEPIDEQQGHTPHATPACNQVTVSASSYSSGDTNWVKAWVDNGPVLLSQTSFSTSFPSTVLSLPNHSTTLVVYVQFFSSGDTLTEAQLPGTGANGWTKLFTFNVAPCNQANVSHISCDEILVVEPSAPTGVTGTASLTLSRPSGSPITIVSGAPFYNGGVLKWSWASSGWFNGNGHYTVTSVTLPDAANAYIHNLPFGADLTCSTDTPTPTNTPTSTYTLTPSNTPTTTPTKTQTPSDTPTVTFTPSNTPTSTFTPSNTPTDTATFTRTFTATFTWTPSATPTDTLTPSNTPTPTETASYTVTATWTSSNTVTLSFTPTGTDTPTMTATATVVPSDTPTDTPTVTLEFTKTPTPLPSDTPTSTSTLEDTLTSTSTFTATLESSNTPTPTATTGDTQTPAATGTASATSPFTATYIPYTDTPGDELVCYYTRGTGIDSTEHLQVYGLDGYESNGVPRKTVPLNGYYALQNPVKDSQGNTIAAEIAIWRSKGTKPYAGYSFVIFGEATGNWVVVNRNDLNNQCAEPPPDAKPTDQPFAPTGGDMPDHNSPISPIIPIGGVLVVIGIAVLYRQRRHEAA